MISGALYHLVATYSVMKPVSPPFGSAVVVDRARPKSHTFKSQLAFKRRFDGLRSRWMTSAEWRALMARRVLRFAARPVSLVPTEWRLDDALVHKVLHVIVG